MYLIKNYIQKFLSRAGNYVLGATIFSRLLSFITSWVALQLINNKELGEVLYAWNIITFVIPFVGLGLEQSLIRYGALTNNIDHKKNLLYYVIKKGTYATLALTVLVAIFGIIYPFELQKTNLYLILLSLLLIPFFLFGVLKIKLRLDHNNKKFSFVEFVFSCYSIVFVLILSYFYKENGYILALIVAPIATVLSFYKSFKIPIQKIIKPPFINYTFWRYGFFASLTSVVSQILLGIDILLIGNITENPEMVTQYRYISIIPLSLLFLPRVFINTDFVAFTENIYDKKYIYKYIKGYTTTFIFISIACVGISFIFSDEMLSIFDADFRKFSNSLTVLFIGISSILILRGLFGNLLCSIGKINTNLYIAIIAIIINTIGNYLMLPKYGLIGVASVSAISMWFTSITSSLCFFYLYKKFLKTTPQDTILHDENT